MDNKAILDEVATRVTVLEQHISRLKNKPEKLHGIDVEVMGEKVKEIYTLIHTLKTGEIEIEVKAPEVKDVDKVPMVEVKPEPEIPEPKAPEMSMEEEQGARSEEQKPKIEVEENEISNEQQSTSNEQLPAPQPAITEPQAPDPEPAKTTADLFSGPKTIADSFQAEEDNSIAATVNPQPTQDLKLAIGINDKFLFINELFQGDPSVYNQAIENMNAAGGLVQALSTLDGYRAEYKWADNSEAYHRLKKIVNSKYNG